MADQQVPWAPGRKALVMTEWGWRAGFGRKSRGAEPDFWIVPEDGASGATWERRISATGRATASLPDQCPRCLDVGTHADGCMVAANVARGVPEFWAPWVMESPPPSSEGVTVFDVRALGVPHLTCRGFVALGPEGPTLKPWGTP